ncbi:hypothetical protein MHUMG1_07378 [Metarhizium humberi]|uniref:Endosomal SPRY domain protein n=1 Tax=Metarhizium humberi TaxID=2596975 RepID=A0A9P8M705_9HYPO|nr:hypothetical protein MHUMG1_07378 [Metarhizium humberi]
MAPVLAVVKHSLRSIVRTAASVEAAPLDGASGPSDGPLGEAGRVFARDGKETSNPSHGVLDPHDINNVGFFVLFALIGVAFVVTGIWFFFWAKNGGFHFKENDWEEYKSTVLRRKGPNGTVLSGATKTTKLGGGSVYKDVADDDGTTVVTESTGLSGVTAGASDIAAREKRKAKQEARERERRKRRGEKRSSKRHVGEDGVTDEMAEKTAQKELRSYRHEKAARVGGLNKESDGSQWDGSTNPSDSTVSSELLSGRQETPTKKPAPIRKVYSTADRNAARESERIRSEARRLREESRVSRRDFSYNRPGAAESNASESLLEGSDLGNKTYYHPMPELRALREQQREERRARRGGYRRGRTEDDDL